MGIDLDTDEWRCSTPCGIEAKSTFFSDPNPRRSPVLNALRHRGEVDTTGRATATSETSCAQRLAASRRSRPILPTVTGRVLPCSTPCGIEAKSTPAAHGGDDNFIAWCSTPCGIEAKSTQELEGCVREIDKVLNALRHRGEVDEHATSQIMKREAGAQRLAASRRSRPGDTSPAGDSRWFGAQRLAASRRSRPYAIEIADAVATVCSTPCGIEAKSTLS